MAELTISISNVTGTGFQIDAVSDVTFETWSYTLDGGMTFQLGFQGQATSVSIPVRGRSPNTTHNVQLRAVTARGAAKMSNVVSVTTLGKSTIAMVDPIRLDEEKPVIQIAVRCYDSGFSHQLMVGDMSVGAIILDGLTFPAGISKLAVELDSMQTETLLSVLETAVSADVTCELMTFSRLGGALVGTDTKGSTVYITEENSAPDVGAVTVTDINADSVSLTGDSTVLIAGVSEAKVDFSAATAKYGASITEYSVEIGGDVKALRPTSPPYYIVFDSVSPTASGTTDVTLSAVDSRGFVGTAVKRVEVIPYNRPEMQTWEIRRLNGAESVAVLSISGTYSPVVVGGVAKNTRVSLYWRYRKTNETSWSNWATAIANTANGTFTYTSTSFGGNFEPAYSYQIQLRVSDALNDSSVYVTLPKAAPVVSYRNGKVGINNPSPVSAVDVVGQIRQNGQGILGAVGQVNTSFNNMTEGGIYWYSTSSSQTNVPTNANGVLLVIPINNYIHQVFLTTNRICVRMRTGSTWSSWTNK